MVEIKIESKGFNSSYDITEHVKKALMELEKPDGIVKICVVGSTAALTVMCYEPGAVKDLLDTFEMIAPEDKDYYILQESLFSFEEWLEIDSAEIFMR